MPTTSEGEAAFMEREYEKARQIWEPLAAAGDAKAEAWLGALYANGLGVSFMLAAQIGGVIGFYLATSLPTLLAAGLLFLTPVSFLISTTRNCRLLADWLALGFGVVLGPLLAYWEVGLDLVWTGLIGGSVAYGIHRLRRSFQ